AYPFAMTHNMPTGSEYIVTDDIESIREEDRYAAFFDITCRSNGAFPYIRLDELRFDNILGRFCVTGWEFMAALRHGLLRDYRINRILVLSDTINFERYITHWYDAKAAAENRGDKLQRLIAKRMMNSLYGKLAQNPVHYKDYKLVVGDTPVDYE